MAGDTLSTAAVIAGGAGILLTGQNWIDPVLSLLIAALIFWSSIGIVRETLNILLEGTPRGCRCSRSAPAWKRSTAWSTFTICTSGASARNRAPWPATYHRRYSAVGERLHPRQPQCTLSTINFEISHTTIQFEHIGCEALEGCVVPS